MGAEHRPRFGVTVAHYHHAVLCNGLSQFEEAEAAARAALEHDEQFGAPQWALPSWSRPRCTTRRERAVQAMEQLAVATETTRTDWALGVEARTRALLNDGNTAEALTARRSNILTGQRFGSVWPEHT